VAECHQAADPAGQDGEGEQENNRWVCLYEIRNSACKKRYNWTLRQLEVRIIKVVFSGTTKPALFFSCFQDANKNKFFFPMFFLLKYFLLEVHEHQSSKITSYQEVTKLNQPR